MKILYVITQGTIGGAQNYVVTLARHFPGSVIAVGQNPSALREIASSSGVPVIPLKHLKRSIHPYHDVMAIREIATLIKERRPDIVHANSSKAGFIAAMAQLLTGIPVIYTAHGFAFLEPRTAVVRWFYRTAERIASLFRARIIAVSDFDRRSALTHHITTPEKIVTIHNGIDPVDFERIHEAVVHLGLNPDSVHIGTIANYYGNKGLDLLLRAVSQLGTARKYHLTIIGNGPERKHLQALIDSLSLHDTVTLHPALPYAARYLRAFDIFVLPSRKEGLPLALLEAMQAGLPIIATNVGGVSEALGQAGILVEPTVNALRQALHNLLDNEGERELLGEAAGLRSLLFTADAMVKETKRVYETLC